MDSPEVYSYLVNFLLGYAGLFLDKKLILYKKSLRIFDIWNFFMYICLYYGID